MPSYSTFRDEVLFDLVQSGDCDAFREIYDRYFEGLFIHAYKRLRNREEARDVLQEVFSVLWAKREYISLTTSLPAYLFAAVRNRILNLIAHKQVESEYIDDLQRRLDRSTSQTDHLVRTNELSSIIEKEVGALPSRMREIFSLSRQAHLSHKEIALQLNLSEETVKKQVHNALKILKNKIGAAGS